MSDQRPARALMRMPLWRSRRFTPGRLARRVSCACIVLCGVFSAGSVQASNAALQDFFFDVCNSASGTLAVRCGETRDGAGDVSGDSESSLNPSQTFGASSASISNARARSRTGRERADAQRDGSAEPESATSLGALSIGPFSVLVNGRFVTEERDRRVAADAERGYQLDSLAAQFGFDYRVSSSLLLGALLGIEQTSLDFDRERPGVNFTPDGRAGSVDQDSISLLLFASGQLSERGYLDGSVGYVDSDFTIRRNAIFQESRREIEQTLVRTRASTDGQELWASVTLGYNASRDAWHFSPYLSAMYSRSEIDGYREFDLTGSGLAMTVGDTRSTSLLGQAGVRISRAISRPGYVLLPQLSAEYVREFRPDGSRVLAGYLLDAGEQRLQLSSDRRDRDFFDVGAGMVLLLPNGWMPFIDVRTTLGHDDLDRYRIASGLRVEL